MTICILGRQPELGLAELECLYDAANVRLAGETCAVVEGAIDFKRLGGSIKAADLLGTIPSTQPKVVFKQVAKLLKKQLASLPQTGKIKLGLSTYGFGLTPYQLGGEALRLKKIVRGMGRSVRVVPNESPALSSAQTFHNSLAGDLGMELVLVADNHQTLVGRVTNVQDIDAYRQRDRERPKRDAFVGMLPPKLAQIIINLAAGEGKSERAEDRESEGVSIPASITLLDPFCGTGVILQEALHMGYQLYGTDLSPKMIDYSRANLEWFMKKEAISSAPKLELADATTHSWNFASFSKNTRLIIASETYLGQPLGGQSPTQEKLAAIVHDTNRIVKAFFQNIAPQLPTGTRLCIAVPAWFVNETVSRLPVVDELASLGFEWHTFHHVVTPLIYHRDNQTTGRELLVLTKE